MGSAPVVGGPFRKQLSGHPVEAAETHHQVASWIPCGSHRASQAAGHRHHNGAASCRGQVPRLVGLDLEYVAVSAENVRPQSMDATIQSVLSSGNVAVVAALIAESGQFC